MPEPEEERPDGPLSDLKMLDLAGPIGVYCAKLMAASLLYRVGFVRFGIIPAYPTVTIMACFLFFAIFAGGTLALVVVNDFILLAVVGLVAGIASILVAHHVNERYELNIDRWFDRR